MTNYQNAIKSLAGKTNVTVSPEDVDWDPLSLRKADAINIMFKRGKAFSQQHVNI